MGDQLILSSMMTCPFCKDSVPDSESIECLACGAPHHEDCWVANGETCAVYGCESRSSEELYGCPWCEEVYPPEQRFCLVCNSPLMTSQQYREFLDEHEWLPFTLDEDENPLLVAGYLRNNGIIARLEKRAPVSMLFPRKPVLLVSNQHASKAETLLQELQSRMRKCEKCGHILTADETECTFCIEETGV